MCIYLYIKTHQKTGLKYLGQTKKDPFKYKGSGVYWVKHIKLHGNEVKTEILYECATKEEIIKWGKFYSTLWNIVESKDWANLKAEEGDGGGPGVDSARAKDYANRPETKAKISGKNSVHYDTRIHNFKNINGDVESLTQFDFRIKYGFNKGPISELVTGTRRSYHNWFIGDALPRRKTFDSFNSQYDHTLHVFYNKDGLIETCTKGALVKKYKLNKDCMRYVILGVREEHRGWCYLKTVR
jgi:hypothetical protein